MIATLLPEGMFIKIRDILVTKSSIRSDGSYMIKVTKDELTLIDELLVWVMTIAKLHISHPSTTALNLLRYIYVIVSRRCIFMKTIALQIDNSDPNLHPEVYIEVEDSVEGKGEGGYKKT